MDDYCKPEPLSQRHDINNSKKPAYHPLRWCACFFCLLGLTLSTGCSRKKAELPKSDIDSLSYTSLTNDVVTLISDSGVTAYKLKAKRWYTYDKPENKWYFPDGIYLEQFDTLFNIVASVQADTAYYYQSRNLWELKNNVRILNRNGQKFYAVTLYWDEAAQIIYSNDPIRIIRGEGEMLESQYGFKSNQTMTKYELYSNHGQMDVVDEPMMPGSTPPGSASPTTSLPGSASPTTTLPGSASPTTSLPGSASPTTTLPGSANTPAPTPTSTPIVAPTPRRKPTGATVNQKPTPAIPPSNPATASRDTTRRITRHKVH